MLCKTRTSKGLFLLKLIVRDGARAHSKEVVGFGAILIRMVARHTNDVQQCSPCNYHKVPLTTANLTCFTAIIHLRSKFSTPVQHSRGGVVAVHPSVQPNISVAQEAVKILSDLHN